MKAYVMSVCVSEHKGTKKLPVPCVTLKENHGIIGDAHAANWHRQVSLLADESADKIRALGMDISAGDFAENILTRGIGLKALPVGTRLTVGEAELELTQIGKECHSDCEIKRLTGKCVMPTEGVFAKVIKGGTIMPGDAIEILR